MKIYRTVEVWHNSSTQGEWSSLPLMRRLGSFINVAQEESKHSYGWYVGKIDMNRHRDRIVSFTVRFKTCSDGPWRWLRDLTGIDDGMLLFQDRKPYDTELASYLPNLDPLLDVNRLSSEVPDTTLWEIHGRARPAHERQSGWSYYDLGQPTHSLKWFALVRHTPAWLGPRHGSGPLAADRDAILYAFLRTDGLVLIILAVSGVADVDCVLQIGENTIVVAARNDTEELRSLQLVVALGRNFDASCAAAVYRARHLVQPYATPIETAHQVPTVEVQNTLNLKARAIDYWTDGLIYCTWNSLGLDVSEHGIIEALASLADRGIRVMTLLIDDGWQDVERSRLRLRGIEAKKEGFPNGLKVAIHRIRAAHPYLRYIAVWHAIHGHWGGIDPGGPISQQYQTRCVQVKERVIAPEVVDDMLVVDASNIDRFYNDFYAFLINAGIHGVKTDVQFALDAMTCADDRRDLITIYERAWSTAHLRYFDGKAMSCMSQTPQNLFAVQLPTQKVALMSRNSDDFFPNVPDSNPWHIFCNAHNALLTKYLNVLPDWDMFQSGAPWASYHAAARCLSGGPISITDEPGKTDVGLLNKITALTPHGQRLALRPSVVGRSANIFASCHDNAFCRIASYHGAARTGASFMGFFNLHPHASCELVHLRDFMGVEDGLRYVARAERSGKISKSMTRDDTNAVMAIELPGHGWDIITVYPTTSFVVPSNTNSTAQPPTATAASQRETTIELASLGLTSHFTGAAAQLSSSARLLPDRTSQSPLHPSLTPPTLHPHLHITTQLKALGTWAIYLHSPIFSHLTDKELLDDCLLLLEGSVIRRDCVRVERVGSGGEAVVVMVDVGRAWGVLGLRMGQGERVGVGLVVVLREI